MKHGHNAMTMEKRQSRYVAMIGGFGHEGFSTAVKALGYDLVYIKLDRILPKTWLKRASHLQELQQSGRLVTTIFYLHTSLLLLASKSDYFAAFKKILQHARSSKMIMFVFQDNLDGVYAMRHWETKAPMSLAEIEGLLKEEPFNFMLEHAATRLSDYTSRKEEVNQFLNYLYETGAEICPFVNRSDVTLRLQEFLHDVEQGVFLRLFVPSDRLQAQQLDGLLSVLERYLRQVELHNFSIDAAKSEKGIVYLFKSDAGMANLQSLNEAFGRFDTFMKLCGDDPAEAESILKSQGIRAEDANFLVDRYSRDYRRLIIDTKHEFERKTLALRQRLESEMIEESSLPIVSWTNESLSGLLSITGGNVEVNIGSLSVIKAKKIHTEVEHLINGSVTYNESDKALLELVGRYAERLEAIQCKSDLDQLKDPSTQDLARQNAKQRLIGFLRKAAKKAGDVAENVAVETLSIYLESLLRGN